MAWTATGALDPSRRRHQGVLGSVSGGCSLSARPPSPSQEKPRLHEAPLLPECPRGPPPQATSDPGCASGPLHGCSLSRGCFPSTSGPFHVPPLSLVLCPAPFALGAAPTHLSVCRIQPHTPASLPGHFVPLLARPLSKELPILWFTHPGSEGNLPAEGRGFVPFCSLRGALPQNRAAAGKNSRTQRREEGAGRRLRWARGDPGPLLGLQGPGTAAGSAATRSQRASGFREDCGSAPLGPGSSAWCASRLCSPPSGTGGAEVSPGQRITRSGQISLGRRQRLSQFEVRALPLPHPMHFNSRDTVPSKSTLSRFEQLHSAEMA